MEENEPQSVHPLSAMQQGMLFHSIYAPESGVNIQQIIGTLRHELDSAAFQRAWQYTMRRHEVLRTAFRWDGRGEAVQEVYGEVAVPFEEQDWRALKESERDKKLKDYLRADRRRGFMLSPAPLLRVALFRWGAKELRMLWTFHHALLDGQSFGPLLKEVFAQYDAVLAGKTLRLPKIRPFRDFIDWLKQRDSLEAKAYWREQMRGFKAPTPMAMGKTASAGPDVMTEYAEENLSFSEATTAVLRQFVQDHGLSLNTLLQGAWALLLSRYSGAEEVMFGVTRSCRRSSLEGAESMVGLLINTLPMRVRIEPEVSALVWLEQLRETRTRMRGYENTPLLEIQKCSEIPAGTPIFESILVFNRMSLQSELRSVGGEWESRDFRVIDQTNFPLTLLAFADKELLLKVEFDLRRFDPPTMTRLLGHLRMLIEGIAAHPEERLSALPMLTEAERHQLLVEWNQTHLNYAREVCIHQLFEAQVRRTPDAPALVFEKEELSYAETNRRADQIAAHLRALGVGPEVLVGICVERSLEMVVGLLGILKAGGAYVPLDPAYPAERLAHMISDSQMPVLLTQESLRGRLPTSSARVVCLEELNTVASDPPGDVTPVQSGNLAYVIYTSGSTGKPKGVMLTHRNVVNFFAGIDKVLRSDPPGTWLAVTSISFDISALELFWTLARGFKLVIQGGDEKFPAVTIPRQEVLNRKMDFSLFYFSGDENQDSGDKYRLLMEGARFADEAGLAAVWTPERHFHAFGGLYPNPSVTSAAIAAITRRVRIRAGSVVLPLHNPIRVAEEWAMVDNLSHGRVDLSFASGWHSSDFVFAPDNYAERKRVMFWQIETFRKLWRGEAVACRGGDDREVNVAILPRPVQPEVPIWITAAGSPETFRLAGEMGANLLTNLLGQTVEEVGRKIEIYRQAWRDYGYKKGGGHVTLMMHTFVGPDREIVREKVRGPFTEYLKTSVDLIQKAASAWSFAAFQQPGDAVRAAAQDEAVFRQLGPEDLKAMLDHAFARYFETSGLFGTPDSCLRMVNQLRQIGVDEIACLIDFGVDTASVLAGLEFLKALNLKANASPVAAASPQGIAQQILRHGVTHLQCTPSLARMLVADPDAPAALGGLREFLVGGEALPRSLADQLLAMVGGKLRNMYGPTETAIWSTTELVQRGDGDVAIGRPLANTETYVLDRLGQPAPVGLPGELHIGGEGVSRGYLNRPDLTAEKFIAHPFRTGPGARVYRTGDLARYRADGTIEFHGRIDHQVKMRGHRIELGEIEAALGSHPQVKEAIVTAIEDGKSGDQRLVAYVVPQSGKSVNGKERPLGPGEQPESVSHWQTLWEETYEATDRGSDPTFNLAGWTSSYTGEAMPEGDMQEWVGGTVQRVLALQPSRVLELGCGAGLLLFRLAPHCRVYCGVDFSDRALKYLRRHLSENDLAGVTLRQGTAVDFDGIDAEFYDTVIINSVTQYFPSLDYLRRVLERAVRAVAPGGRIFIGDVRSLPLLEAFHASLELLHCPPGLTRAQFRQRVASRVSQEEELVIDPAFFEGLPDWLPQIGRVQVQLKPGRAHNELTRFRYDVVLHVGGTWPSDSEIFWIDWPQERMSLAGIRERLSEASAQVMGLARVPNARLHREKQILQWLNSQDGVERAGDLCARLTADGTGCIDPESLLMIARETGFGASATWSETGEPGTFDAIFWRQKRADAPVLARSVRSLRRGWNEYANRPARKESHAALAGQLRKHLRQSLPAIMVPSGFVMLEALPLTPNGKVDRRQLPAPDADRPELKAAYLAPATPVEEALAAIWRAMLGLERVGTKDSFFELGGHSLLATQMVSRLREVFKVDLPLRVLFEGPTIEKLAQDLGTRESRPGFVERTAKLFNELEQMSPEELERAEAKQRELARG
jgi:natural product biosynthesis luciferase-like monooxygenase protein